MYPLLFLLLSSLSPPVQESAVDRGLAAIQPRRIKSDLYFLADDVMRGRDTPSPEQRLAARYLRSRLAAAGFEPGGDQGSFFDEYSLAVHKLDLEASSLTLETSTEQRALTFGRDYFLGSSSEASDLDVAGEVVFAGEGRKSDFETVGREAVEGRWVFCLDSGRRAIQRRKLARENGAIGLLLSPGPGYEKAPYADLHGSTTQNLIAGRLVGRSRRSRSAPAAVFPQVFLDGEVGATLHGDAGLGEVLEVRVNEVRRSLKEVTLENVCGLWRGSDPELSKEVILISAHYDHVGVRGGKIYNGADDNGSGTSALLALVDALAAHGPMRRSVLLIWVSGEEKGLLGSAAWAADPTLDAGMRAVCNLNLDMVGRNAPERLGLTPSEDHAEANFLSTIAREQAPLEGFPILESADEYYSRSDHASFAKLDIPVCFLFAGEHEDYHKPTDTPDKIDFDKIHRVARLVFRMVLEIQEGVL
jgi:hypothetical protein